MVVRVSNKFGDQYCSNSIHQYIKLNEGEGGVGGGEEVTVEISPVRWEEKTN